MILTLFYNKATKTLIQTTFKKEYDTIMKTFSGMGSLLAEKDSDAYRDQERRFESP